MDFREEKDTMGSVQVPKDAFYGPQTQRAVLNFPVSGITFSASFIHALALVKKCAAQVNAEMGILDQEISDAIIKTAQEDRCWSRKIIIFLDKILHSKYILYELFSRNLQGSLDNK